MFETTKFRLLHPYQENLLKADEKFKIRFTVALKDQHQRLAESLKKRGLYTMGIVDDGYGDFLGKKVGTHRGFDHFQTMDRFPRKFKNDATTVKVAME